MTLDQAFAFAIILGTMGLLIWGRIRYDLVAPLALLISIACGIVKPEEAFRGFSDDIVIIVGSALVVSAAIGRSGLVESLTKPLVPRMRTSVIQVAVLASAVTALSAFNKNIGRRRAIVGGAYDFSVGHSHVSSASVPSRSLRPPRLLVEQLDRGTNKALDLLLLWPNPRR